MLALLDMTPARKWKAAAKPLMGIIGGRWHGTRGSDKVVFASDYPLLDIHKTTMAARGLALPDADLRRVLYENGRALLFQ